MKRFARVRGVVEAIGLKQGIHRIVCPEGVILNGIQDVFGLCASIFEQAFNMGLTGRLG